MAGGKSLQAGTVLQKRYEIYSVIGNGGFGITYRAFDYLLNRFVAIKEFFVIQSMERGKDGKECVICQMSETDKSKLEDCRANFRREARIMERLKNIPYISRIQESFSENNTEYIVMKLLSGESLMHYVKKSGRITARELFPMMEQILFAVEQMHEEGIIHRDISPKNMIRTEDGDLFLIDFGAATSCDRNSELWNDQVFNHIGFDAPEHLNVAEQGTWTDTYSICASVFYLLTGEGIPIPEERVKTDCVPQMLTRAGLSSGLQNSLLKGLALDRRQRYASAAQLRIAWCGETAKAPEEWTVRYAARTDIGARKMNQDNLLVDGLFCYEGRDFERSGQFICRPDELHMIGVCDGVGGANQGELASWAAVQALMHFLEQYRSSERLPERLLDELLDQMNEKIISLEKKIGTAGTTVSILLWKGNHYWTANIGDSPIYLLRRHKLRRLSTPHTKAYVLLESQRVPVPADWHTLVNYLGKEKTAGSQMAAIRHGHLQEGDVFLVCSDGVTNQVNEKKLKKFLLKGDKNSIASIWKVLDRKNNNDNCSAVVVQF